MLKVMRDLYAVGEVEKAVEIAVKAAPYVHAKLAHIDANLHSDNTVTHRFVLMGAQEAKSNEEWEASTREVVAAEFAAALPGFPAGPVQ